ncbi:MAG: hypothetical protein ACRBEE_11810 [Arenicella sp.]
MTLSNTEQEMVWINAWNDLAALIQQYPDAFILTPDFTEVSKEEAESWIQRSAYESNTISFRADYFKGITSIFIHQEPA